MNDLFSKDGQLHSLSQYKPCSSKNWGLLRERFNSFSTKDFKWLHWTMAWLNKFARCWSNFLQLSAWKTCCMGAQLLHKVSHTHHLHHPHHQHCHQQCLVFLVSSEPITMKAWWPPLQPTFRVLTNCNHTSCNSSRMRQVCALQDIFHLILSRSPQSTYHYPFLQLRTQSLRNWLNCRKVCGAVGIYSGSICLYVSLSETAMPF